jgi:hypothetical protein
LRSNLTINLGLHYEIDTPYYERNNQWVNFDPTSGAILVAGQIRQLEDRLWLLGAAWPWVFRSTTRYPAPATLRRGARSMHPIRM